MTMWSWSTRALARSCRCSIERSRTTFRPRFGGVFSCLEPACDRNVVESCPSGALAPFSHNEEPTLEQMLSDDIVQLVMARDRMTAEAMRQLASEVRDRARHARRLPTGSQGPHSPTDAGAGFTAS